MRRIGYPILAVALSLGAACDSSTGPGVDGPSFFHAYLNGTPWRPANVSASCENFALVVRAGPTTAGIDYLFLTIGDMTGPSTYTLSDVTTGRFAQTWDTLSNLTAQSGAANPGWLIITGVDLTDSVLAGRFAVSLTSLATPPSQVSVSGTFRLRFEVVGTSDNPDGTPCHGAT